MKDERNVRKHRTAGGRWAPAAVLLAAVLLVLSVPFGGKPAYAVDLDANCSLEVTPGSVTMAEDLATANVVIDLYRVADAVPVTGYDTYDWQMNEPFAGITIEKGIDSTGWKTAAQAAADVVLGKAPEGQTAWNPSATVDAIKSAHPELVFSGNAADAPITGLKAGLYLVIAHGSDVENYAAVGTPESAAEGATTETAAPAGTVTIANSRLYAYKFAPELVSLPTKAADPVTGEINTANPGDWIYDAVGANGITLKPSQEPRAGNLQITKILDIYEQREKTTDGETRQIKDDATFIFEVSVYENQAAYESGQAQPTVYHDMVSMVFNGGDTWEKSVLIEDLPVNSYAVVKEVYPEAGSQVGHYYLVRSDGEKTILANETVEATFENTYNNENSGGGSVTNKFTYKAGQSKWGWQQVEDDSTGGVQNVIKSDEANQE